MDYQEPDALFESDEIKVKYPALYGRFYEPFKDSQFNKMRLLVLLVKNENTRDYSDLITIHYFFSRFPNLAKEYNFVPSQNFRDWFDQCLILPFFIFKYFLFIIRPN